MKFDYTTPSIRFTNMDWVDYEYEYRTTNELITIATLYDGLLSTIYSIKETTPIGSDMDDWEEQGDAYLTILECMLTPMEYKALVKHLETLKEE